ncbi:S-layer homology domain-containing protein [Planococcus sp. FY231025]|uniref:S-layer homology domain-containing protein n=1 Tax=Planococcus sp. FY231025 TaxID=3455699 RepID=UPI003F8FF29F
MAYQPKSYKKFVATAATATLVATAVVPAAFADDVKTAAFTDVAPQYKAAVDFVVEQAIAKGISETQFGISKEIIRGDAAIMIANAAGLNNPDAPSSGFTDVPTRGALAINSLKAAGVTNGKTATSFDFNGDITRGEAAVFLANAFKLKGDTSNVKFTDVNSRYMAAVAALVDNGVTNGKSATQFGTDDNITRGDFARWIHALEEYIVKDSAEVASVTPLNANQIEVKFKTTLTTDTAAANLATDVSNYELEGMGAPDSAVLGADKKTVVLTYNGGIEGTDELFVVYPVATTAKDANGNYIETAKFSTVYTYTDSVKPVVTGTSYANGVITVNFSEALSAEPTVVRVNNQPVAAADYTIGADGKSVTITKSLNANETASLYIAGALDSADTPNEMAIYNGSVTAPSADLEKPRVTSVQVTGQNTAKVTLSEDIQEDSFYVVLQQGATQDDVLVTRDTTDTTGKTYTFSVDDLANWTSTSTTQTYTLFLEEDEISDSANNDNDFYSTSVTFTKDTTAPVLASSKVATDRDTVELAFNENISVASGTLPGDIKVRNSQGVDFIVNGDTYDLDFVAGAGDIEPGTYTITVPAGYFTDAQGNASKAFSTTVVVPVAGGTVDNELEPASVTETGDNEFTLYFDEELSQNALNLSNYRLDGQSLPAGTDIFFTSNAKTTVVIQLPEGSVNIGDQEDGAPALLTVLNVADKAGNVAPTTNYTVAIKDNTSAKISSVQVAGDEVVVTFNEALDVPFVDANDVFNITVGGTTADAFVLEEVTGSANQVKFSLAAAPAGSVSVSVKAGQDDLTDANGYVVK